MLSSMYTCSMSIYTAKYSVTREVHVYFKVKSNRFHVSIAYKCLSKLHDKELCAGRVGYKTI